MNLFLLRHGIAVERGIPGYSRDSDRPLTPKGERRLANIADAMEAMGLTFDLILSSPYVRARQTAEIVTDALGLKQKLEFSEALTPDGDAKTLIAELNKLGPEPGNVLLVGHEPFLSALVSLLTTGEPRRHSQAEFIALTNADDPRSGAAAKSGARHPRVALAASPFAARKK